jgi:hypothetical protein
MNGSCVERLALPPVDPHPPAGKQERHGFPRAAGGVVQGSAAQPRHDDVRDDDVNRVGPQA